MLFFNVPKGYEFIEYELIEEYLKQLYSIWKEQLPEYYYDHFIEVVEEHATHFREKFLSLLFFEDFKFEHIDINRLIKTIGLDLETALKDKDFLSNDKPITHRNIIKRLVKEEIRYEPTIMKRGRAISCFAGENRIAAYYLLNHQEVKCCVIKICKNPIIQVNSEISEVIKKWRVKYW